MKRNLAILGISFAAGLVAILLVQREVSLKLEGYESTQGTLEKVLVSARDLTTGSQLKREDVEFKEYPEKFLPRAVKGSHLDFALNSRLIVNIGKGEPIFWSDLEVERKAGAAALLERDKRAVTIPVDNISGVAGLIEPGSHVDLLAVVRKASAGAAGGAGTELATQTLLENVRVVAAGRRDGTQHPAADETQNRDYTSITVEVDVQEAHVLLLAMDGLGGRIYCLLRSPEDSRISDQPPSLSAKEIWTVIPECLKKRKSIEDPILKR